jgi:hypothetical protein
MIAIDVEGNLTRTQDHVTEQLRDPEEARRGG